MKNNFTFNVTVTENEIDALNHVNNLVYIQWVLNAAEKHWELLSSNSINEKYVWVVLRHEIDYLSAAMLHDEVAISTYIGESNGAKSERFVEIRKGDKLLVKAKTIWCLLDRKSMRALRIPSEIVLILK